MQLEVRRTKNNKHLKGGRKKKKKEARMSKKFTSLKGIYRRKYFPSTFLTSLPFPFADHVQLICNQACNTQLVGSKTDKKKMANIWFTEIILSNPSPSSPLCGTYKHTDCLLHSTVVPTASPPFLARDSAEILNLIQRFLCSNPILFVLA